MGPSAHRSKRFDAVRRRLSHRGRRRLLLERVGHEFEAALDLRARHGTAEAHAHRLERRTCRGSYLSDPLSFNLWLPLRNGWTRSVFASHVRSTGLGVVVSDAFEGSIGLVNLLQATRILRKGFDTSILLYGPGVTLGVQRGFPKIGDEAFPGHQNFNNQITKFIGEGGKVYACRFALQALYGHGEPSLIEGIKPISPLDVLDLILLHRKSNSVMIHTWTL